MASTSNKVELDFFLFENIDRLKQVSRPTSFETVEIQLMPPGNVLFTTANIICEQRQSISTSNDVDGRQEVEQGGPFAECSVQQSQKSGTFRCKFKVGKPIKLRMRLKFRLHATLTKAVARGVDLLSNELKLNGGRRASDATLLGRAVSGVSAGRFTRQQINSDIHVTHGAECGTDTGGRCQTKTGPIAWDAESTTSANSEQVPAAGTHSNTSGLSSKIHPSCICPTLIRLLIYLSIKLWVILQLEL